VSSHVEIEDLEQECFKRIFKKLSMYDASKSQFTTWASRVCVNLLNGNYRKSKKHQDRFVAVDMSTLRSPLKGDNENERHDMLQAIEDLFELYPQWVLFLSALFGGRPSEKGFDMPMKLSVRKACRATGTPFDKASPFYIQVVRPFFTERFC
jgi:hypothetical protein